MAVHDWTRVDAGIFHDFHLTWIAQVKSTLNGGLLPEGYYALAEQHAGRMMPDVLTLHASPPRPEPWPVPTDHGGTAVAEAPPRVRHTHTVQRKGPAHPRTVAIRHVSGHRLIALIEIVSPSKKDRPGSIEQFVSKAVSFLNVGVHLLLVDLFPPGRHDPHGMHSAVLQRLERSEEGYDLPQDEPLTAAAYAVGDDVVAYVEHFAVGGGLPEMPLFLNSDRYVNVPLEKTYEAAMAGLPAFWRDVLDAPRPAH